MKDETATTTKPLDRSGMEIPDHVIERMAKCLLPLMRKHFESITPEPHPPVIKKPEQ